MKRKILCLVFGILMFFALCLNAAAQGTAQMSLDDQIKAAEDKVNKLKRLKALQEEARELEKELLTKPVSDTKGKTVDNGKKEDPPDKSKIDGEAKVPAVELKSVEPSQVDPKKNNFTDAAPVLTDDAQLLAKGVLFELKNQTDPATIGRALQNRIQERYPRLFFLTVANKVAADPGVNSITNLEAMRFMVETARTDKHLGASSGTAASTSAIDTPGFANLLGFAIENGYIEKNVQDTVLTLSTSPSAFFSMKEKDATKAYRDAGLFNRIGLSASFNINSDNPLLANATRSQLREYSVRYRFYGDRSSRSPELEQIWEEKLVPVIQKFLTPLNEANILLDDDSQIQDARDATESDLVALIQARVSKPEFKALKEDEKQTDLTNIVLNFMKLAVSDKIIDETANPPADKLVVTNATKNTIRNRIIAGLITAQNNKKAVSAEIKKRLDDFFKGPLGTVAYINHRDPLGNYSEFKFLYEQENAGLLKPFSKFIFNGGLSYYHNPNPMMNQRRLRDFSFALSLEGKKLSPFNEEGDLSHITYSFTGRYERLKENEKMANKKADLAMMQFLLNFPLFKGMILPISLTYSNATQQEAKQGVRLNFGIKFDSDKLLELSRFNRLFK